jgi:hypothetical protein
MSTAPPDVEAFLVRMVAQAAGGDRAGDEAVKAATRLLAETLVSLIQGGRIADVRENVGAAARRKESSPAAEEVHKRVAEAQEEAARADLPRQQEALLRAQAEESKARAAKAQAEADAIRLDAETRRLQAMAEARAKMLDRLSALRQYGGDAVFNAEMLKALLRFQGDPADTSAERLLSLKGRLPDLAPDLSALEAVWGVDLPLVLNKVRYITEKVLHRLATGAGVSWGEKDATLENMIGPLTSRKVIPKNVAIHVHTIQKNASAGSHYQEHPLSEPHGAIARAALVELLEWYSQGGGQIGQA